MDPSAGRDLSAGDMTHLWLVLCAATHPGSQDPYFPMDQGRSRFQPHLLPDSLLGPAEGRADTRCAPGTQEHT